jgi:hypothetical protein
MTFPIRALLVTCLSLLAWPVAAQQKGEPLSFPRGNGLRIVMTGHSWVGPARRSLPKIAAGAGLDGHRQRAHTGGGGTGSANSIWLKEIGKYNDRPALPILTQAIATGQWDVMTWGGFHGDKPEHLTQWMDLCLKHNPQMVFYLQDGWPLWRGDMTKASPEDAVKEMEKQMASIRATFATLHAAIEGRYPGKMHVTPAGDAVVKMVGHYFAGRLPGFDCVSEHLGGQQGIFRDGGHLSAGAGMDYLAGYVYYAALYKKSPELITGFAPRDVPTQIDRLFRQVAWQSVLGHPHSGVTDKNSNGIADSLENLTPK